MTPQEIAARLRPGGVALAFDTNALFGEGSLFAVCNDVSRHNEHLATRGLPPVRLVVSAVAHAEKLFDLKQQFQDRFDGGAILRGLTRKGLAVQSFDADHALETAQRMGERHATPAAWHEAKSRRSHPREEPSCLHVPARRQGARLISRVGWPSSVAAGIRRIGQPRSSSAVLGFWQVTGNS